MKDKFYFAYTAGIIIILALPLLAAAPLFHPPAWAKAVIFRIIFSALVFLFFYQLLIKKDSAYLINIKSAFSKKSRIFLPLWLLIFLFIIYLLAVLFSLEPLFSLWGSPYRGGGFVNYAFYILFALFVFIVVKPKDWRKIWIFVISVGIIESFIAIFQKFSLFQKFILSYSWRPVGTLGGPMFLATFLLVLSFIAVSLAVNSKGRKRYFYSGCLLVFIFTIVLSATRSAFLGLGLGLVFFFFFYPDYNKSLKISPVKEYQNNKGKQNIQSFGRVKKIKISLIIIIILSVISVFWLRTQPELISRLKENKVFGPAFSRAWSNVGEFSIENIITSRGDGWKVALKGVKNRPVLGYGPENFSIAFDKYYDSSLPGITRTPGGRGSSSWWDRGHNFIFDISISAGIPALIIYLLLFITLFWQLQKIKSNRYAAKNKNKRITAHGIQAAFIAYLTNNLFNFDVFSTFLISFLLIAYSLSLIYKNNDELTENKIQKRTEASHWQYIFLFILFFIIIWFVWQHNLKPLSINKEINEAVFFSNYKKCNKAVPKIDKLLETNSILNNYLRLSYIDIITSCSQTANPKTKLNLSQKAVQILKEAVEIRPSYTRSWEFIGIYSTKIISLAQEQKITIEPEIKNEIALNGYSAFEKAHELSPKRQKIFDDIAKLDMVLENFEQARENINKCIALNPNWGNCWFTKALIEINIAETEKADESIKKAEEKGFITNSKNSLGQLINAYSKLAQKTNKAEYYYILADLYRKLIDLEPTNPKYHASLGFVYRTLGLYQEAKKEALIVLKLAPELKKTVDEFLESLP